MARVKIGNVFPSDEYLLSRCAPAGSGLGEKKPKSIDNPAEVDLLYENGWYAYYNNYEPLVSDNILTAYGAIRVDAGGLATRQTFYPRTNPSCAMVRSATDLGPWSEWEWVNPPMDIGVEYRTTERYMGKPVYTKLVDCGGCPGVGTKTVAHNTEGVVDMIVSAQGNLSGYMTFPSTVIGGAMKLDLETSKTDIVLHSSHEWMMDAPCFVLLKYTKI